MLSNAEYMKQAAEAGLFLGTETLPSETLKMATAIVVTGPILLVYPFVQKYFVKGIDSNPILIKFKLDEN